MHRGGPRRESSASRGTSFYFPHRILFSLLYILAMNIFKEQIERVSGIT